MQICMTLYNFELTDDHDVLELLKLNFPNGLSITYTYSKMLNCSWDYAISLASNP